MARVKQIRYFGTNSQNNSLDKDGNLITADFLTHNIVESPLSSLGVRALPGTKFYINNNLNPIIISHLGIFEIDFRDGGVISSLRFDEQSVRQIDSILAQGYIIVDMLEKGGTD